MRRYPAFDPPEYINWVAEPDVMREFRQTIRRHPVRSRIINNLAVPQFLELYEGLLRHRLHEIALKRWVKQGVISKAWLGTGEEAVTIGCVHALNRGMHEDGLPHDIVSPVIRNGGACHEMGMPISSIFKSYLGTADSPSHGRDVHFGDIRQGVIPPISHMGDMVGVCAGVALSFKMRRQPRVALTWVGDGATGTGAFHEGLRVATALRLPLIVVIQNNQIALGTPVKAHHKGDFMAYPQAYGCQGAAVDGNNVLDVYAATKWATDQLRGGEGPILLIAETFRMGGHATHDEAEGRRILSQEEFEYWGKRDPIGMYESYLIESHLDLDQDATQLKGKQRVDRNRAMLQKVEDRMIAEVDAACEEALQSANLHKPHPETLLDGVYCNPGPPMIRETPIWKRGRS